MATAVTPVNQYTDFTVKWATLEWEVAQAHALRRRVFCQEQGLFEQDDRDDIDDTAQLLVAIANQGGWHERIVGTVRIHEADEPNGWWGSRLAVEPQFRHQRHLGGTLIKLAVSSAHGLGCEKFYAQVQKNNEKLFQKLHWKTLGYMEIHGAPHVKMIADLAMYPPCQTPRSGFVVRSGPSQQTVETLSPLLYGYSGFRWPKRENIDRFDADTHIDTDAQAVVVQETRAVRTRPQTSPLGVGHVA